MKPENVENSTKNHPGRVPRVAILSTSAFYALIVLEFFYMASPFATYFYSAYGPGLDWLGKSETTAWTTRFILPHIVSQTPSLLVNAHTIAGLMFLLLGLLGFAIGAFRIYREKLGSGGIVQSGLYKYIRHPQYASVIVASFGTLLIWPRMLAVIGFAFVLVLYIALAKSEEKRCISLDPGYREFLQRTGFFLPRLIEWPFRFIQNFLSRLHPVVYWPLLTILCLSLMIASSVGVRNWSTNQIQGVYSESSATIAIGNESISKIDNVLNIATADYAVVQSLNGLDSGKPKLINYVLPTDMYVSEVPMDIPKNKSTTHHYINDKSRTKFKIIFTEAVVPTGEVPEGIDIIKRATNKNPIVEVWVDLKAQMVEKILPPPDIPFYNGMPVPVF